MSLRYDVQKRRLLELIQHDRGHETLTDAVAEALDQYIDRYLAAALKDAA